MNDTVIINPNFIQPLYLGAKRAVFVQKDIKTPRINIASVPFDELHEKVLANAKVTGKASLRIWYKDEKIEVLEQPDKNAPAIWRKLDNERRDNCINAEGWQHTDDFWSTFQKVFAKTINAQGYFECIQLWFEDIIFINND